MAVHLAARFGESRLACMLWLCQAQFVCACASTHAARFVYILIGGSFLFSAGSILSEARASVPAPFPLALVRARRRMRSFPLRPEPVCLVCFDRRTFGVGAPVVCSCNSFARAVQTARWSEASGHNRATFVPCAPIFFAAPDRSKPARVEREPRRLSAARCDGTATSPCAQTSSVAQKRGPLAWVRHRSSRRRGAARVVASARHFALSGCGTLVRGGPFAQNKKIPLCNPGREPYRDERTG